MTPQRVDALLPLDNRNVSGGLPAAEAAAAALGPVGSWSAPLRTAVELVLAAPVPMALFWGGELKCFYNDAARMLISAPGRLGEPGAELGFPEWPRLEPALRRCLAGSVARVTDALEQGWRLSPVFDDAAPGGVGGVLQFLIVAASASDAGLRPTPETDGWFRSVFDAELMGMRVFDAHTGETLAVNDRFLRMTGHDRADVDAGRWRSAELVPDSHAELEAHAVAEARERGWWQPYETVIRRRDGSTFPARVSSAPLPGQPGRLVIATQDITVELAAKAALVASEERLRLGLEAGRMVTWEFDLRTGVLTRSANSEAIFGWGDRPQDYTERMPAEDVADDKLVLQLALTAPDGLYQSEFRYNHPDGSQMYLHNWGKIMRDAAGEPTRVHGVCVDITERKRAENALKHLNETLEQEVRKRTDELVAAEEALRQSQKMEALGHLTGGVAHDFNNLLGAMVGSFDLIRRRAESPARVRDLAEAGLTVAERGAKLTSQLLTFSRGQRIELRPVRLADILRDMKDLLERTVGPSVRVRLEIDPQDCATLSDATQLEMAVLNLAINARDAMPDGGILTISTQMLQIDRDPTLAAGAYVELVVRDTGTGMSADVAALAFDPFFTTKDVGKGTGLGLSQVYGIARQAGGIVRIDSTPGHGTAVQMLLPGVRPADPVADPAPHAKAIQPAEALDILLVDDDPDLRDVMASALDDLGYVVRQAADGHAALVMLEQGLPDVMIVDFAMPGMTGAELATTVRTRWPTLPIVFASGYADTDAIGQATGPRTRLLRKPFRIAELEYAIIESLADASKTV